MNIKQGFKDIGNFQWCCMLLYTSSAAAFVMANVMILLIAPRIDYHCNEPAPWFQNLTFDEQHEYFPTKKDQCLRLSTEEPRSSTDEPLKCDTGFVYDHSIFLYTVTEKFNLVCEREWLISFAKTIFMLGYFVGAIMCGALSDRFGRKIVMVTSGIVCTFWHILCGYAPGYELFLVGRFLTAVCCISFFTSGQILHTELVRKDQRKVPRALISYSIGIIGIILSGIALWISDFRNLQILLAALALVTSLLILWFIPESPRWLTSQLRHEEAQTIVKRMADFNKWPQEKLAYLLQQNETAKNVNDEETDSTNHRRANLLDLFRTPLLRKRTFVFCTLWFCHILVFYALLFNLDSFWPDVRVSMMISAAIELPMLGVPFFTIDFFGRQFMSSFYLISCGICCLCMSPFVTLRSSPVLLGFALVGKLLAVNQFFISSVYIQELYPTVLRTQGIGVASTVARIAGMLAPQLSNLNVYWPPFSVVTLGLVAIFGGLLTPTLPDTTGTELPQTLEDGENFLKDHTYRVQIAFLKRRKRGSNETSEDLQNDEALQLNNENDSNENLKSKNALNAEDYETKNILT